LESIHNLEDESVTEEEAETPQVQGIASRLHAITQRLHSINIEQLENKSVSSASEDDEDDSPSSSAARRQSYQAAYARRRSSHSLQLAEIHAEKKSSKLIALCEEKKVDSIPIAESDLKIAPDGFIPNSDAALAVSEWLEVHPGWRFQGVHRTAQKSKLISINTAAKATGEPPKRIDFRAKLLAMRDAVVEKPKQTEVVESDTPAPIIRRKLRGTYTGNATFLTQETSTNLEEHAADKTASNNRPKPPIIIPDEPDPFPFKEALAYSWLDESEVQLLPYQGV